MAYPLTIGIPVWERHLAAITIEAGRLSHTRTRLPGFMLPRLNGTYF
jgi:hypothetical protein